MPDDFLYSNGIDALTGELLLPPLPPEVVARAAQGQPVAWDDLQELRTRRRRHAEASDERGVIAGVDPNDLAQAGWGVIFAFEDQARIPAIREALAPLLRLRQQQAGERYRDDAGSPRFLYRPGESKYDWLERNGGAPGVVDPRTLPYYLLIVGDPTRIPYRFQSQLDVAYAVGRIHFDTLEEYDHYARAVAAAEDPSRTLALARRAAFFGVQNGADQATRLSATQLVDPLAAAFAQRLEGWQVQHWDEAEASKNRLTRLLGGDDAPAFLFSASHGMGFPQSGHPRQRAEQGALICGDWSAGGAPEPRHYLSAGDIGSDARVQGLIAFLFACYGAGTPQFDDFAIKTWQQRGRAVGGLEQVERIAIAPEPFIARLPQRLLGHPKGGALAVVGNVDRTWTSSFQWGKASQVALFESALTRLFRGDRLGAAMEDFSNRYAELSTEIADRIDLLKAGEPVPQDELARLWTANNDARNYVVLGDPAVRLAVAAAQTIALAPPPTGSVTLSASDPAPGGAAGSGRAKALLQGSRPRRTIYALFVGIDAYPRPVKPLNGCVNDVTRLRDLLAARVTGAQDRFVPLLLADAQATRQGIIDAWRGHLGQAGPGDVALFYYSGHGSQENAPPEFWDFEPDRLNETLVCHDSRTPGGWDLADKELAQLISEVAAKGAHFAVILDCCHSGSGTRDADEVTARQARADIRARPIASYIVTPQQVAGLQGQNQGTASPAMPWAAIATGRHILLAACRPEQTAKETTFAGPGGNEKRGAFSFYLQDTLQQTGAALSYRDIAKRVNALVQQRVADQQPQLEASVPADLDQPFLGGAIPATSAAFTLSADKNLGWVIDAGAVHGIPQPANGDTTQLAIFPFDAGPASLRDPRQALGQASVTQVYAGQCLVKPARFDGAALDRKTTYRTVVTATPLPPLTVAFEGDSAALDFVRQALATAGPDGGPSLLVRESPGGAGAEYRLQADAEVGRYRIRRATEALSLAVDTPGMDADSAMIAAQRLEHIARWASAARLTNPTAQMPRDAVQLEVFRERKDGTVEEKPLDAASGIRLDYELVDGGWRWPRFRIRLRNTQPDRRFFCMLLDLTESYSVYAGLLPKGGVWLEPSGQRGDAAWASVLVRGQQRTTIDGYIPDGLFEQYMDAMRVSVAPVKEMQVRDILKLIVSTEEADATLLQQGELPVTPVAPALRDIPQRLNTLNRLMMRVHTRDFGVAPGSNETFSDWTTVEVASLVVRPAEAVTVA